MFNQEDNLAFRTYLQSITSRPRMMEDQLSVRKENYLWCEDWEIIEILKCLFHTAPVYRLDPPPNRLKGNPLFNMENIIAQAQALIDEHKTSAAIIEVLKTRRGK